jgi:hypothetical protein
MGKNMDGKKQYESLKNNQEIRNEDVLSTLYYIFILFFSAGILVIGIGFVYSNTRPCLLPSIIVVVFIGILVLWYSVYKKTIKRKK